MSRRSWADHRPWRPARQAAVTLADLDTFKEEIEDANRSPQGMLHLAVGYNF